MQNKLFTLLTVLFLSTVAQAQVITSKKEALKKGVYESPAEKPVAVSAQPKKTKTFTAKPVKSKRSIINEKPDADLILGEAENYLAIQMINNAMDFIGVNYRGGGTSRAGMDCSGMVTAVFNIFGMKL